jgi:hypothetical protein
MNLRVGSCKATKLMTFRVSFSILKACGEAPCVRVQIYTNIFTIS